MKSIFGRTVLSFFHYKRRNILIVSWFFLLLLLLVYVTLTSIASSNQVEYLNKNVGNCVITKKISEINSDVEGAFNSKEMAAISELPFVENYNAVGSHAGRMENASPVVKDKDFYEDYQEDLESMGYEVDNCTLFGLTNSEIYTLFTSAGFTLQEGMPIMEDNGDSPIAVISESLAAENNLKIGDTINVTIPFWYEEMYGKRDPLALTITGLFHYPQTSNLYTKTIPPHAIEQHPANYIFIPSGILSAYCELYVPLRLYIYLDGTRQVESCVDEIKSTLGSGTMDSIYGPLKYDYTWNEAWFSTVSKPAQEISNMTAATAIGLALGTFVIILLIYALLLNSKKYEMGIYLSLGESKTRLVIQTVFEELAPLLAALILACLVGVATAPAISRIVMEKPASETNAAIEQQREEIIQYELFGATYSVEEEIKSIQPTYFYVDDELNINDSIGKLIIYTSVGIVVMIIALAGQVLLFLRKSPARLLLTN